MEEGAGMGSYRLLGVLFRIPCHIHKQLDGILHRLQVAHVQNPHALNTMVVG